LSVLNEPPGVLVVKKAMNFELMGASSYSLNMKVTDVPEDGARVNGLSALATYTVTVNDINDAPTFLDSSYTFEAWETMSVGSLIGVVFVGDEDRTATNMPRDQLSVEVLGVDAPFVSVSSVQAFTISGDSDEIPGVELRLQLPLNHESKAVLSFSLLLGDGNNATTR
jgi:hypothetical protein